MTSRTTPTAAALFIAAALMSPAHAGTMFFDDFSSGDDANWTHVDLLDANGLGPTIYDASSFSYEIASSIALPPLPVLAATASAWTDSLVAPASYSDGIFQATMQANNDSTNLALAARTGPDGTTGYSFFLNVFQGAIGIADVAVGFGNLSATEFPLDPGVVYHVQASFIGSDLSIKVWADGDSEPLLPQVSISNSLYSEGSMALAVYNQSSDLGGVGGQLSGTFDNVSFVPEPATAVILALGLPLLLRRRSSAN